jgi:hypothetical protein
LIPEKLKEELKNGIDHLKANEIPDYHPGSKNKVRDLVHPGLYCYVDGVSKVKSEGDDSDKNAKENSTKETAAKTEKPRADFWGRQYESTRNLRNIVIKYTVSVIREDFTWKAIVRTVR